MDDWVITNRILKAKSEIAREASLRVRHLLAFWLLKRSGEARLNSFVCSCIAN